MLLQKNKQWYLSMTDMWGSKNINNFAWETVWIYKITLLFVLAGQ